MTRFYKDNNNYSQFTAGQISIEDRLPAGNYIMKYNSKTESYYLEKVEDFTLPSKMYGDTLQTADKFFNTFMERTKATGVLLSGEKGSGKTLLAKALSLKARDAGIPTITIANAFHGTEFNSFIQNITQDALIMFDEFEKVYDREEQAELLTILDGTLNSKKLFVFTVNNIHAVGDYMKNRPGRIYYLKEYQGMNAEFIEAYCKDNLKDMTKLPRIQSFAGIFKQFNFDMMQTVVEEVNRYPDEEFYEQMKTLNLRPEQSSSRYTVVEFTVDDVDYIKAVHKDDINVYGMDYFSESVTFSMENFDFVPEDDRDDAFEFDQHDLITIDNRKKLIKYSKVIDGRTFKFTLKEKHSPSSSDYMRDY